MRKLTYACIAITGLTMAAAIPSSQAAPLMQTPKPVEMSTTVEKVGHGRYCRMWHWECRERWGFGWRYRRCMARHGC